MWVPLNCLFFLVTFEIGVGAQGRLAKFDNLALHTLSLREATVSSG